MAIVDAYLGEIRMFAGNYAPVGWVMCDGATLPITGNEALFSLLGTTWGGDGHSNFGLPDLRGRTPVGMGQGTGLTSRVIGQSLGSETVALTGDQMPAHTHVVTASGAATATSPTNAFPGQLAGTANVLYYKMPTPPPSPPPTTGTMIGAAVSNAGSSLPHDNVMPSTVLTYLICTVGIFPTTN
jgi:microcystin-dependent protein